MKHQSTNWFPFGCTRTKAKWYWHPWASFTIPRLHLSSSSLANTKNFLFTTWRMCNLRTSCSCLNNRSCDLSSASVDCFDLSCSTFASCRVAFLNIQKYRVYCVLIKNPETALVLFNFVVSFQQFNSTLLFLMLVALRGPLSQHSVAFSHCSFKWVMRQVEQLHVHVASHGLILPPCHKASELWTQINFSKYFFSLDENYIKPVTWIFWSHNDNLKFY